MTNKDEFSDIVFIEITKQAFKEKYENGLITLFNKKKEAKEKGIDLVVLPNSK
jgi:hypothetical protein